MTTRRGRSELAVCLAAGLLGGGLLLLASQRPWEGDPAVPALAGDAADPLGSLVSSLGAVVLLGTVVVAVTRALGRRLAGVVVVLAAAGTAYAVLGAGAVGAGWSGWRLAAVLGTALGLLAGALAAARGPRWAGMSRRYDAPSSGGPQQEPDPWRALDRGEDPTL